MATIYKCPTCGGNMLYDAELGQLKCEQCSLEMPVQDYQTTDVKEENNAYTEDGRRQYRCPSCGATLMTDTYTAATNCAYCGSPNVIEEQVDKDFKPDIVLPFQVERKEAVEKLNKWCRGGILTPSDFLKDDALKAKLNGIYVPFWVYDIMTDSSIAAHCERVSVSTSGNKETTKRYKYHVKRSGKAAFARIPRDASKRMDNKKMDLLEPFQIDKAKEFSGAYLSGFSAERYSETKDEVYSRASGIARQYAIDELRNTIGGYDSVNVTSEQVDMNCVKTDYALYPVWHYEYKYNNKLYEFMMNGQTGKVVGKPPVSLGKVFFVAATCFVTVFSLAASMLAVALG